MPLNQKNIHIIGIGGIGTSALAKLFLYWGIKVSGSDLVKSEITAGLQKKGVKIFLGHKGRNLPEGIGLVIYSSAVLKNNPERREAKKRGIKELSYFEFLGELSRRYKTVAVAGSHGKSTTTALLGQTLIDAGKEPLIILGSKVSRWPEKNIYLGKPNDNQILVLEACEWQRNFLHLSPHSAIITNIDNDHLDTYKNLANIKKTFYKFASGISSGGFLILNGTDKNSFNLQKIERAQISTNKDYKITREKDEKFTIHSKRKKIGEGSTHLLGDFNLENILMASLAARKLGVSWRGILKTISKFKGIWRRLERVGNKNGIPLFLDYAHHPAEIGAVLKALREHYPDKKLFLLYQPHQIHRTKVLFDEFADVFKEADELVLTEIYGVSGRERGQTPYKLSESLAQAVSEAKFIKNRKRAFNYFYNRLDKSKIGIIMSAGNIHEVILRNMKD